MAWLKMVWREIGRRLAYWFHRDTHASDLEEEMRLHIDLRAQKLEQRGLAPAEAGYAAQRQFGNRTHLAESSREMWGWGAWERLVQDVHHALRRLRKTPGFAAVAVLTLALGLGMNTAVFSVVNAVMIRRLPYQEPHRLISLW